MNLRRKSNVRFFDMENEALDKLLTLKVININILSFWSNNRFFNYILIIYIRQPKNLTTINKKQIIIKTSYL